MEVHVVGSYHKLRVSGIRYQYVSLRKNLPPKGVAFAPPLSPLNPPLKTDITWFVQTAFRPPPKLEGEGRDS